MRFVFAHKLTTYLMVFCAFAALVLSDELSAVVIWATLAAILGSWLWEEPRVRISRFGPVWAVLSLLVLAYTLLRAFTGGDFLVVGVEYLLFLLVAKLFNRSACRDYLHIYALTLLMLVAGTVLNPEITYGVFFLGYVISTTWALILFHLRREMEENFLLKHSDGRASEPVQVNRILNSRRIVGRKFFAGTALVSVTIFLSASVMFLAIPRIGFGLFFQNRRAGVSMAGFSDGITLGRHGTIKSDRTVVMRVKLDETIARSRGRSMYWRGVAFDEYKNGQWQRSRRAPRTTIRSTAPEINKTRYYMLYHQSEPPLSTLVERSEQALRQQIYLEPIGYDVLFGASMPVAFEFDSGLGTRRPRITRNDEMRLPHGVGIKYEVYSDLAVPDADRLRAAPKIMPEDFDVYLQVPGQIPQRVIDHAREITRNANTDYDKAAAVAAWLRSNLAYTVEMRSPGGREPIDFFLFERQQGHCEYFSSAMTILVRALDIPARNVNGFVGGEWNEYDQYMAVRAGDAHSWVEVYFHGIGWVTFDPTPSSARSVLNVDGGVGGQMRQFFDTLRFRWFQWVIDYDLYRQLTLFRGVADSASGSTGSFKSYWVQVREWLKHNLYLIGAVALLGIIGVSTLLGWRRIGTWLRFSEPTDPMTELYQRIMGRLDKRGHGRAHDVTPREHARALAEAGVPGAAELGGFIELYYASVYGGQATPEVLQQAQSLIEAMDRAWREAGRAPKP